LELEEMNGAMGKRTSKIVLFVLDIANYINPKTINYEFLRSN